MLVTVKVRTFNLFKSYITNPTFSRKTLAYHRKFMPNTWKQKVKIYHGNQKNLKIVIIQRRKTNPCDYDL